MDGAKRRSVIKRFNLLVHQFFRFTDWTGSRETLIAVGKAIRAFPPAQVPSGATAHLGRRGQQGLRHNDIRC